MERSIQQEEFEPPPWWLAQELACEFCPQILAIHTEFRCTGCDRVLCRKCVLLVKATPGVWCPECGTEQDLEV